MLAVYTRLVVGVDGKVNAYPPKWTPGEAGRPSFGLGPRNRGPRVSSAHSKDKVREGRVVYDPHVFFLFGPRAPGQPRESGPARLVALSV